MDEEKIRQLLVEYQKGTLSPENRLILEAWYTKKATEPVDTMDDQQLRARLGRLRQAVMEKTEPHRRLNRPVVFAVAASVLLFIVSGLIFFQPRRDMDQPLEDVMPGGNKAILITGGGQVINLNEEKGSIVVGDSGIAYHDGTPVLGRSDRYTVQTPNGGRYHVTLPDGSQAWLNAASSLHYPANFENDRRVVDLQGEAYFEISHQSFNGKRIPFLVKSQGQEIKVLGTSFNVSAYHNEQLITTLFDGKISVSAAHHENPAVLAPGQETVLTATGMEIRKANLASTIAWKEGKFRFDQTELRDVMQQLSRWYDLEIVYRGEIPRKTFYGVVSRDHTLARVLDLLKESGVNFKIEKSGTRNKLIVFP